MRIFEFDQPADDSLPVYLMTKAELGDSFPIPELRGWVETSGFAARRGELLLLPGRDRHLAGALFGLGASPADAPLATGSLARKLPAGSWHLEFAKDDTTAAALGFALGSYRFDRYRKQNGGGARLVCPPDVDRGKIERMVSGCFLARDLVNTPVNDMGPDQLETAVRDLAGRYGATVDVTSGDALLDAGFPMIHAVGRASSSTPRLIDMGWGRPGAPKVTLVGKGVCFDTGGLDIKPAASMLLMKKDMGGAANVLALAMMVMDAGLDFRLRVLIPAVENAIAGNAFRPGDILTSRKGLSVEIGNTDAEGRLVLADALTLADEEEPDLVIDMATLTGAARVALGPDLPPFYCRGDALAAEIDAAAQATFDPLWRMPLFMPYDAKLASPIADINNAPAGGFAGSITAALFLGRFVEKAREWAHFDIFAWNPVDKPHAPVGGEAQAVRALYHLLEKRYGVSG